MDRVTLDCPDSMTLHWLLDLLHTNWLPGGDVKQYDRDLAHVVDIARQVNETE